MGKSLGPASSITFIGFGEVGQILCADLVKQGVAADNIRVYDKVLGHSDTSPQREAAQALGVSVADNAIQAARGADLIICAVTAANDLLAAQATAPGASGAWYLDVNSASPGMKIAAAQAIEAAGGHYVEAAVMSPVPPKRLATAMLIGGPHAKDFVPAAAAIGLTGASFFSDELGKASATKMCRSVIVKGMETLLTESMLTARYYGIEDVVLKSLQDLFPLGDWNKLAHYMISRSIEHGTRKAEEMREVARTVQEAGIEPLMSTASSLREDWAPRHQAALVNNALEPLLDAILVGVAHERAKEKTNTRDKP